MIRKLVVLLFIASPSIAAIAHVQNKWCSPGTGATGACAFTSGLGAGSLVVVGCGGNRQDGVNYTVTDNNGGSYTLIGSTTTKSNGTAAAGLWYAYNHGSGATTVTCQDTGAQATWIQLSIHEYSGAATSTDPLDVYSSSAPAAAYSTTIMKTGSATTTGSNEMMVGYCNFGLGTVTSQSGTLRTNNVDNAYMASQDQSIASPSAHESTFTVGAANNSSWVCLQAAFKEPSVATTQPPGIHRWE